MRIEILTPRGPALQADTPSVILPLEGGYMGVKEGHLPLTGLVVPGALWWRAEGGVGVRFVSQGIVEIAEGRILVLTDASEAAEDIDLARAEESFARAQARMAEKGIDRDRAALAKARAAARLKVARGEVLRDVG